MRSYYILAEVNKEASTDKPSYLCSPHPGCLHFKS